MQENDYIEFEAYIAEALDAENKQAFEARLDTDDEFDRAFQDYKKATRFLSHRFENEEKRHDFKGNLEQIATGYFDKANSPTVKVRRIKPWYYSFAAAVILLFGIVIAKQFSNPTYNDFANYGPISLTVRGGENKMQNKAEKAFNQKDYRNAEKYLSELIQKDPNHLELQLYRAVCLVEMSSYTDADALLQHVIASPSVYNNKAKWYLALSKLKQKDEAASINVLKSIPMDAEDYERSRELLNKLE